MRYHLPAPPAQGQKETLRLLQLSGGGSQRSQRAAELELGRAKDRGLKLSKAAPRGEPAKRGRLGVRNPDIAVSRVGEGEEHKAPSVASTSSGSDCWIPNYTAKPNPHTNEEEHRTLYNGPAGLRRLETFVQETVPFRPPPEPARQPCPLVMGTHDTSVLGPCRCYQDEGALPPRPPTRRRVLPDEFGREEATGDREDDDLYPSIDAQDCRTGIPLQ